MTMTHLDRLRTFVLVAAVAALPACDDGEVDSDEAGADAGEVGEWQTIASIDWTLPPPTGDTEPETYRCKTITVPEDMYIAAFRPLDPDGTHHTVLTASKTPVRDDGEFDCYFPEQLPIALNATGVGSGEMTFPEGVGFELEAGQQIMLNVHLFNASDSELSGTSGVEVYVVPKASITQLATVSAKIDPELEIEPGIGQTETGSCTVLEGGHVYHWWPHMHKLGRRMSITINGEMVFDEAYSFESQAYRPADIDIEAGDVIDFTCTYDNPTDDVVGFGGSTNEEMCFLAFWHTNEACGQDPF